MALDRQSPGQEGQVRVRFHLRSGPFCPLAQRVMVALAVCGASWSNDPTAADGEAPTLVVTRPRVPRLVERDHLAMLDLVEAFRPGPNRRPGTLTGPETTRRIIDLGVSVQSGLSAVTRATESNEHDMAIFRLRDRLQRLEDLLPPDVGVPGAVLHRHEVVLGPTLWRLRVLDQHCETYLMTGLPRIAAWERTITGHAAMRAVFPADAERIYLSTLRRRGAVLLSIADAATWRLLIGHSGQLRGAG
ncbi:hypothetical protein [Rubellimicrobium arenae]|uniref:hypothetical protein n=1 Tax=Rubellimicrobium arenae TaxID=2817372 RepID=UPI001B312C23|nr:hypothetical protein [Rubellimicrobium arenae]